MMVAPPSDMIGQARANDGAIRAAARVVSSSDYSTIEQGVHETLEYSTIG
jgi:hypothetical protein